MMNRTSLWFAVSCLCGLLGPILIQVASATYILDFNAGEYVWHNTILDLWMLCILVNAAAAVWNSRISFICAVQVVAFTIILLKGILVDPLSGPKLVCFVFLVAFTTLPSYGLVAQRLLHGGSDEEGDERSKLEEDHSERLLGEQGGEGEASQSLTEEGRENGGDTAGGDSDGNSDGEGADKKEHASLRRLVALVKPERVVMCYAAVALVVSVTCSLAQPYYFGKIIDACSQDQDETSPQDQRHELNGYIVTLFVIFVVGGVFTFIRGWLYTLIGERLVARLRKHLFEHIIRQDIQFFDQNKTGELMNRLASDTTVIQSCLSVNVSMGLRAAMQILISLLLLFITSWRLTLVMISVVPVLIVFVRLYGRYTKRLTKAYQDALGRAADTGAESIGSSRIVKSFAAEDYECERYFRDISLSYEAGAQKAKAYGGFSGAMFFVANTVILVVVYYGAVLVIEDSMTVGNLTTFIFYTIFIAIYLGVLSGLYSDFMNAVGASERIFQIMDTVPRINTHGGLFPPDSEGGGGGGHLVFEDVSFSYPTRPDIRVLNSFSLEVKPGQTVAIVGASGSGKSTVFALLERYYEVGEGGGGDGSGGRILLDGVDIRELDPRHLHTAVSIVPQEPTLFSGSIFSNIIYSSLARDPLGATVPPSLEAVQHAAKQANAHEFIMQFPDQYNTLVGERGVRLSGGQKQRIAIARALMAAPKVLLLDEATSALDSESEQLVQQAVENLMGGGARGERKAASGGITVMIIAHRLSTVRDANQIVMLGRAGGSSIESSASGSSRGGGSAGENQRAGEGGVSILDVGTHEELLARCGPYRNLVRRQLAQKKRGSSSSCELDENGDDEPDRDSGDYEEGCAEDDGAAL